MGRFPPKVIVGFFKIVPRMHGMMASAQSQMHCTLMERNFLWTSSSKAHSFSSHSPRAPDPCASPISATTLLSQPTSTHSQSWAATSPVRRRISHRGATNNELTGGGNGGGGSGWWRRADWWCQWRMNVAAMMLVYLHGDDQRDGGSGLDSGHWQVTTGWKRGEMEVVIAWTEMKVWGGADGIYSSGWWRRSPERRGERGKEDPFFFFFFPKKICWQPFNS